MMVGFPAGRETYHDGGEAYHGGGKPITMEGKPNTAGGFSIRTRNNSLECWRGQVRWQAQIPIAC